HDFRPDYARLGEVRRALAPARTLALTATATHAVREDICRALALEQPARFVAGFDRPNLFLEVCAVRSEAQKHEALAALLRRDGCGIVYTATRKGAEKIARLLRERGHAALCYHAGLDDEERRRTHEAFRAGAGVVVATNALGMGLDKPDIRFVAHFELPRSVEAYYQEIGRAGRDGQPAHALLLFNYADAAIQERLIALSHPTELVLRDVWEYLRQRPVVQEPVEALARAVGARAPLVVAALKLLEQAGHVERGGAGEASCAIRLLRAPSDVSLPPRATAQRAALAALAAAVGTGPANEVFLDRLAERAGLTEEGMRRAVAALASAEILQFRPAFTGRVIRVLEPSLDASALRVNMRLVRWQEARERALLEKMVAYARGRGCR
ncbi:MAG: helicase-related protein, partial [Myxococcales bacterium]